MPHRPYVIDQMISAKAIAARVEEIAREIVAAQPRDLLVIAILRGSFIFAADLVRALHRAGLAPSVEFMQLASYHSGMASSGQVTVIKDIDNKVDDRDVLLIDDILESGRTLAVPPHLRTPTRKKLAAASGENEAAMKYLYSHDFEGAYIPQAYLPEGRVYYQPGDQGLEKRIRERLEHWHSQY